MKLKLLLEERKGFLLIKTSVETTKPTLPPLLQQQPMIAKTDYAIQIMQECETIKDYETHKFLHCV